MEGLKSSVVTSPDLAQAPDYNVLDWARRYLAYRRGDGDDPGPAPTLNLLGRIVTPGDLARAMRGAERPLVVAFVTDGQGGDRHGGKTRKVD